MNRHAFTYNNLGLIGTETIETGTPLDSFTAGLTTYDYNNLNQLLSSTNPNQSFAYDDDGNMTQGYTPEGYVMTMIYDAENRLTSAQYTDSSSIVHRTEYFYSGDNLLAEVKKFEDGVLVSDIRFVRAGFLPIQERDGNNNVVREYTWGLNLGGGIGGLLNLRQGENNYSYLYDGKGNVMSLIDSSQNIVASYRYDEFGKLLKKVGTLDQSFGFSTKQYDQQTGFLYYGYRFNSPFLGHWITRDPIGERGGINLYQFVGNNAINFMDPFGLWRWPWDIYNEALEDAQSKFPTELHNGPGDAYRHCLASCMMTMENGEPLTDLFGWANEKRGDWTHNQQEGERVMDDINNEYGRKCGKDDLDAPSCAQRCYDAATNGQLKTYTDGTTPGYW